MEENERTTNWRKKAAGCLCGIGAGTLGIAALVGPGKKAPKELWAPFQNRNVAHRGLYTKDQSVPENSLEAFRRAAEAGYGIELDVQLSKDGRVVVFHDDDLKRVCGVDKPVAALTFLKLRKLQLFGTEHQIPLFSEVLACVAGRVPLIVELKSGKHNRELCEKTMELLSVYSGEYCVESFDPRIVGWFKKNAPQVVRGQLACPYDSYAKKVSKAGRFVMSRCLMNSISRPQFIAYQVGEKPRAVRFAEFLGAKKVCWTSHDPENEKRYDTVIFEHYLPSVWFDRRGN